MNDLLKLCKNVEETDDNFIGVRYNDGKIEIIFPIGYRIPNEKKGLINAIKQLFKLIKLVHEKKLDNCRNSEFVDNSSALPIDSYQWIINDYLNNGIYVDIEKTYHQENKGKINWKKTFKTQFLVNKKSLIYLNPIVEKKSNIKNIISEIHAYCVDESTKTLWFLYDKIKKVSNIKNANFKYYINVINEELNNTFDDRKKTLLLHMKRILQEKISNDGKNNIKNYGIKSFEYVWEYIVDRVYGTETVKRYYPTATYCLNDIPDFEASKLRPDTIMKDSKNNIYILDSKYYKAGISSKDVKKIKNLLPSTDSIQKQITYGKFIEQNYTGIDNIKDIYNSFIIPFNKLNNNFNLKEDVNYLGYSICNWEDININKNSKFYKIALIFIDTTYIIDCFFGKNYDRELLVNKITEVERKDSFTNTNI